MNPSWNDGDGGEGDCYGQRGDWVASCTRSGDGPCYDVAQGWLETNDPDGNGGTWPLPEDRDW